MTVQLAIRVEDALVANLDALVPSRFATRTDAIRAAIEEFVERQRRADIGSRIIDGYRRNPAGELSAVAAEAGRSLGERLEPWDWTDG